MPEGDTILRAARTLHRALAGRPVVRFESVLPALFLCGIHPQTKVDAVGDAALDEVLATAQRLMRANVIDPRSTIVTYRGFRRTRRRADPAERLWVYGRARKPCRKCGTPIRVERIGPHARLTYYCPRCQEGPWSLPRFFPPSTC